MSEEEIRQAHEQNREMTKRAGFKGRTDYQEWFLKTQKKDLEQERLQAKQNAKQKHAQQKASGESPEGDRKHRKTNSAGQTLLTPPTTSRPRSKSFDLPSITEDEEKTPRPGKK